MPNTYKIATSVCIAILLMLAMAMPVSALPTISSFTPSSAYVGDFGQTITIKGTNFTGATAVSFTGLETTFTVVNATTITAALPDIGISGPIAVTTSAGTVWSTQDFVILPIPEPTINSFSPDSSYMDEYGQEVIITGTNFNGAASINYSGTTEVTIGGWIADFTVVDATTVKAILPQGVTTGPIAVTTSGGTAVSAKEFTVKLIPVPTISSFTPESCYAGEYGKVITITGTNFTGTGRNQTGTSEVTIGGWGAQFTVVNATTVTAILPQGVSSGPIMLTTAGGIAFSQKAFTVNALPKPVINSFTPDNAAAGQYGQTITIKGKYFIGKASAGVAGTIAVSFNGWGAAFTVVDDTTITAKLPQGVSTGPIEVTTSGGTVLSSTNFLVYQPTTLDVTIDPGKDYSGDYTAIRLNYSLSGGNTYTGALALDSAGKATIGGLKAGSYSLSISGSHWLKRVISAVNVNGINSVKTALANGDADGGNSVNLFDFVALDSKFGSSDAMADLNGDGAVNLFDYVIIDQSFGALGDGG